MATELPPPPRKEDARFDNWVFTLWKRAVAALVSGGVGVTAPITITTSGTGTINIGHGTSGVVTGTYGGTAGVSRVTVDTYGHITAAANLPLQATTPILVGSNAGTFTWGHSTSGAIPGTYGGATSIPQVVVNTYGHVTALNTFAISPGSSPALGTRVITTSGTQALFSGIASGAKFVQVAFDNFSMSGTGHALVQLGDAGGIEATAYQSLGAGAGLTATSTAGFLLYMNAATGTFVGRMDLMLQNSAAFTWVEAINGYYPSASALAQGAGVKSLSAELPQLRVISSGTDTFDAGSINILYE